MAARTSGFLSGPTGVHSTQKIRKHKLKRGITRDMNSAAGTLVNTKSPYSPVAQRIHQKQDFLVEGEDKWH